MNLLENILIVEDVMENNESAYTITDILYYIYKKLWLIIILAIAFGVAGYYYSTITYRPYYIATASMVVNIKNEPKSNSNNSLINGSNDINQVSSNEIYLAQKLVNTYTIILKSNSVMQSVVDDLHLNIPPQALSSFVNLNAAKDTQIIYVTVSCDDPKLAMDIANSLMKVAPDAMMKSVETGTVNVLDKAEMPGMPVPLNYTTNTAIGALVGVVIGVLIALLIGIFFSKIRNSRDIIEKLELTTLGEIPHVKSKEIKDYNILITNDAQASYSQAFMMLGNIVHFMLKRENLKTVIVTSAMEGEGKTTIASNMALSLTNMGKKVLLIDCDFRRPSIRKMFYISAKSSLGIVSLLNSNADINDCIIQHSSGVHVLPGFMPANDPLNKKMNERLNTILSVAKTCYDYIIIDTSPAYIVSDAAILSGYADGIVLVTRQEHASLNVISDTVLALKKCGANILGCVLNDIKTTGSDKYKYYHYSKYYNKQKKA
jgi:polysaccharide biosynthesis transport protein